MLACDNCKTEYLYKVRIIGGKQFCKDCVPHQSKGISIGLSERVFIDPEVGYVSAREIDEVWRKKTLICNKTGERFVGRIGKDGRIEEKHVDV